MKRYPLYARRNLAAYASVMIAWIGASVLLAMALKETTGLALGLAIAFTAVAVMVGMSIMFAASLLNLRKLRRGFEWLADGAADPEIPPVWCPVLTMATRAALALRDTLQADDAPTPSDPITDSSLIG